MARGAVVALVLALALSAFATNDGQYCYYESNVVGVYHEGLDACLCDTGVGSTESPAACDIPSTCPTLDSTMPLNASSPVLTFTADLVGSDVVVSSDIAVASGRTLTKLSFGTSNSPICGYPEDNYVYEVNQGACSDSVTVSWPVLSLGECGFSQGADGSETSYSGVVQMQFSERITTPRGVTLQRIINSQAEVVVTLPTVVDATTIPVTVASKVATEAVLTEFDYVSTPGFVIVSITTNVQEPYVLAFSGMEAPNGLAVSLTEQDGCTSGPCTQRFTFVADLEGGAVCNVDGSWFFSFTVSCLPNYECTASFSPVSVTADVAVGSICRSVTVINGVSASLGFVDPNMAQAANPTVVPSQWFDVQVDVTSEVEISEVTFYSLKAMVGQSELYFIQESAATSSEVAVIGASTGSSAQASISFSEMYAATVFGGNPESNKLVTLVAQVGIAYGDSRRRDIRTVRVNARRSLTLKAASRDEDDGEYDPSAASAPAAMLGVTMLAAAAAVVRA